MKTTIQVTLPSKWSDFSRDNPKGPPMYMQRKYKGKWTNILQISSAVYLQGKPPNPSEVDLISLAQKAGISPQFGEVVESRSGKCKFGRYGSVQFRSTEYPRAQVLYLSNGRDFILASYLCTLEPDISVVEEAQSIVIGAIIKQANR